MHKKEWYRIILLFVAWLLGTQLILGLAPTWLPFVPSFPYASELPRYQLPEGLTKLAHFDGVHYLTIAERGYLGTGLIQAFFPLLPLLMQAINLLLGNYLASGLLLTHVLTLTTFWSFYYLVKLDWGKQVAWRSLCLLVVFVSSFYLRSLYTESLFLSLLFGSLIAAKHRWYLTAGVAGALLSATRVTGIFVWPALLWLVYQQDRQDWRAYLLVSVSSGGLLAYMTYLQFVFGDWLYFFRVQSEFGASRQSELISFPQVVWRYLKILWTVRPFDWKYYIYVQEFVLSLWALWVLLRASLSRDRALWSYLIFAWPAFFLPPLTGNFSSMPRYLLVCFPLFIYLAAKGSRRERFFYLTSSLILLIINLTLFAQGYWVA